MSRRILRPTRAQVAALLAAPVLGLGLLAPAAFADTPPPGPKVDSGTAIGRVCQEANAEPEDGQDVSCERDIAPLLSRLIGPGSGITCRNSAPTAIVCRRE
ncbi:hypothetical protein AQI95_01720 [Streptomyces yokosukanensis]|uniref:Chaplin domain-containing protein n=1 Tax=Streptomyces yokosukanensis TaxID=67386 RepID=A0A101PFC2_9ACTN|nr:hypothetical protein [Streptomyces yokosukanensis]KUN10461.1 hypothetical protein AQI95_01720 [Streptomyces yokosukanensis]